MCVNYIFFNALNVTNQIYFPNGRPKTDMRNPNDDYDAHLRRLILRDLASTHIEQEEVHGKDFFIYSEVEVSDVSENSTGEEYIDTLKGVVKQVPYICSHSHQPPPISPCAAGHQSRSGPTPTRLLSTLLTWCSRFLKGEASRRESDRKPKS